MYDMFTRFSYNVQTLRICCAAWQCIFSAAYPSYETGVITLPFVCYCVMIDAEQRTDRFYTNLADSENCLNHVLSTFVDSEHEITNFWHSHYVDMSEIQSIFQNSQNEFPILTLNIQSVNAKFDNLFPDIDNLSFQGLYFGGICLQETWTLVISICRYCNSMDNNLFTRVVNAQSTAASLYTQMRITIIKYGIYIPIRINGKVCLSTSTVATFVVNLQLGIYTCLLTIITIIQIYKSLYRSSLPL